MQVIRTYRSKESNRSTIPNEALHFSSAVTFRYPVCHAIGENAEAHCETRHVKYEICNADNAVCQLTKAVTLDGFLEVTRNCSDNVTAIEAKRQCEQSNDCVNTAYCRTSGCMATSSGKDFNYHTVNLAGYVILLQDSG